jgi:hypothetical protein
MENTEELQKQQLDEQPKQDENPQQPDEAPVEQEEPTPVAPNDAEVADTQSAKPAEPEPAAGEAEESNGTADEGAQPQEKMISQGEVDRIIQARIAKVKAKASEEAREAARKEFFERYGVGDDNELDEMFGNGQKYKLLNDEFGHSQKELEALRSENALLKSGVREEKFNDVMAVLSYNGQPVTVETIAAAAESHPEWFGDVTQSNTVSAQEPSSTVQKPVKPSIIKSVGSGPSTPAQKSEKELAFEQMGLR